MVGVGNKGPCKREREKGEKEKKKKVERNLEERKKKRKRREKFTCDYKSSIIKREISDLVLENKLEDQSW